MICHGCSGRGWVETTNGLRVYLCPVCHGRGWIPSSPIDTADGREDEKTKSDRRHLGGVGNLLGDYLF